MNWDIMIGILIGAGAIIGIELALAFRGWWVFVQRLRRHGNPGRRHGHGIRRSP